MGVVFTFFLLDCRSLSYIVRTILVDSCHYRSIPSKRPQHRKRSGSHFRGMNGERALTSKRPGILSTVRNGKRPGHVSIFDHFFTIFFGPSTIKSSRISFPSKLCVPYSIASAVRYCVRYMECMCIGIDPIYFNFYIC